MLEIVKHYCIIKKFLIVVFVLFSLFIGLVIRTVGGIGPNFDLELPFSYGLGVWSSSGMIREPTGRYVAEVDRLNIYGHSIVGYKEESKEGNYLIVNMKTHKLSRYGNQEEFERVFHASYPEYKLKLLRPTFFFNLFRYYKNEEAK